MKLTQAQIELLDKSLHELCLPERLINCLEKDGIYTVENLLNCRPERLLSLPNVGPKSLEEIYAKLARKGFIRSPAKSSPTPSDHGRSGKVEP